MSKYVRVISMDSFLKQFSGAEWAPPRRKIYCFSKFKDGGHGPRAIKSCRIEGNPFKVSIKLGAFVCVRSVSYVSKLQALFIYFLDLSFFYSLWYLIVRVPIEWPA